MLCRNCPRNCNVDRQFALGFCGVGENIKIAKTDLFMWEEPIVSGKNGSGAIFFSGCNLQCDFCQNYHISCERFGKEISTKRLAEIFYELEQKGAENINLVSPSHYVNKIIESLNIYKPNIPVVYNSNGYDAITSLYSLKKYVDVYLVDLKYFDDKIANEYSHVQNYFEMATEAILEMVSQQPEVIVENGIIKKGVVVRHMVLPSHTDDSVKILNWLSKHVKGKIVLSLLSQYTPVYLAKNHSEINRKLRPVEYKYVINKAIELGFDDGFAQEIECANENFIPIWDLKGV